jgi:hypothetical protein
LNSNIAELKIKYTAVDIQHIKSLLEEFDNNVEMVSDILAEETCQSTVIIKKS